MINSNYSTFKTVPDKKGIFMAYYKPYLQKIQVRRTYLKDLEYGFNERVYHSMELLGRIIPSRTNLTTKTGQSEVVKGNYTNITTSNIILITNCFLLNNVGANQYIDYVYSQGKWHRPVVQQVFALEENDYLNVEDFIPHNEYSLEGSLEKWEYKEDKDL